MDLQAASQEERFRRGYALLREGHYAEGFQLFDAWREIQPWNDLPIPRWRGGPVSGRLLITGEHGYGDQIMFARFARLLQEAGADVVWMCDPALERLFNRCLGVRAISRDSGQDIDGVTCYCPAMALPNAFFPPLTEPPAATYLDLPPALTAPGLSIGVAAIGNPGFVNDAHRSLPADLAAELLAVPGVVDLRPESTGAKNFYDTARVIAGLNLVIAVDTSVAHLAGALGKPVWILLPHEADWRWMRERSDTPWYRSARLFRQTAPGDWRDVLDRVIDGLRQRPDIFQERLQDTQERAELPRTR